MNRLRSDDLDKNYTLFIFHLFYERRDSDKMLSIFWNYKSSFSSHRLNSIRFDFLHTTGNWRSFVHRQNDFVYEPHFLSWKMKRDEEERSKTGVNNEFFWVLMYFQRLSLLTWYDKQETDSSRITKQYVGLKII